MLILRDIGFLKIVRFNRILESIPGLTPSVLSMRLRELEEEGFIECVIAITTWQIDTKIRTSKSSINASCWRAL
jgi:DNA-binding Lrp family transcriptional regulator